MSITNDFDATTEDKPIARDAAHGVLANDTDPGGPLTVNDTGTDATSQGGAILIYEDGSYVYRPPHGGFIGTDTYTYEASNSATGTLTIEVAPAAVQPEIRMADHSLTGLVPVGGEETVAAFPDAELLAQGSIVALAHGGYATSFAVQFEDPPGTTNRDIFIRAYAADGSPAGPALQIDGAEPNSGQPLLAALPNGGFVAAWEENPDPDRPVHVQFFTDAGAAVAPAATIGSGLLSPPPATLSLDLTRLSNGNFAVTWIDSSDARVVQIFAPNGDAVGGQITLEAAGDERKMSGIAADHDGGFVVAWLANGVDGDSISARRYTSAGLPDGAEILVRGPHPGGSNAPPSVNVLSDGGFAVGWTDAVDEVDRHIHSQVVGPDDVPVGAEFVSDLTAIGTLYGELPPKVTALADGYLLTWNAGSGPLGGVSDHGIGVARLALLARVFDNSGAQVSGEILVHDFEGQTDLGTIRYFGTPVELPDGGFAIGMHQYVASTPDPDTDSLIQLFDAAGNRIGDREMPHASTPGFQTQPSLALLAGGDLAVMWSDFTVGEVRSRIMHFDTPAPAVEDTALIIPLRVALDDVYGNQQHLTRLVVGGVPGGSHLVGPAGTTATFDSGTGLWTITGTIPALLSLTLTPPANFHGTVELTATVFAQNLAGGAEAPSTPLSLPIAVAAVNDVPVVTSDGGGATATLARPENGAPVTTVTATDPDSSGLAYSINGGADAALFVINAHTGALRFAHAPDFEAPADANHDNLYQVVVKVADGEGDSDTQALSVRVTNLHGVSILGTSGNDRITPHHTVKGQPLPTAEADHINGNAGNDRVNGGGGNDVLIGCYGDDKLIGGAGDDHLDGRFGHNRLTGGAGDDVFAFSVKLDFRDWSPRQDETVIADFHPGADHIELSQRVFHSLDRISYDSAAGALLFDPDGHGGLAPIQFASLAKHVHFSDGDIVLV